MLKLFLSLAIVISTLQLQAAIVRVSGSARGYEGRKIAVIAVDDELSGKRNLLTSADVHDDGTFQLEFEITETQRVYIHIQRIEAALYVEPGAHYNCSFPEVSKNEFKRFDRTEVELQWPNPQATELNAAIRKFNLDYSTFIYEHFYDFASMEYRGSSQYLNTLGERKSKVDLFAKRNTSDTIPKMVDSDFKGWVKHFDDSVSLAYSADISNVFFAQYVKFAIAEMYLLSGMSRSAFYETYFMSIALPMHNPAFINCFKVYYQNLLTGRKSDVQSRIIKSINVDRNLDLLSDVFAADSTMQSQRIRRLACLNGLREVYYNKSFDRGAIDLLLRNTKTGDTLVDGVAQNILYQFKRCAPGELMPSLTLTNETQEKWSVSDYNGVPLYLYFFATWSPTSLKELLALERWETKFAGRVEFVAVAMDDDYMGFRKYLEDHPKQMLTFVYGNADPFIQEKINLKAIPYQLLIDEQGKIVSDAAAAPSDSGFEAMLNRVALKADGKQQHPKTWKDH